jgi:hypothetical protein
MRPILLASALLACAASAPAQTIGVTVATDVTTSAASIDDVVFRLMSFDRNNDGSIAEDELIDRMRHLVARGDADGSRALDRAEIRTLAGNPPASDPATMPFLSPGYAFGSEVGLTSRAHIEGAIDDLRLPADVEVEALARARSFVDRLEADAQDDLLNTMEGVLPAARFLDFSAAVSAERERGASVARVVLSRAGGGVHSVRFTAVAGHLRTTPRSRLEGRIEQYGLAPTQDRQARAAIERFNAAFRPGEIEWSPLLSELKGNLSGEQRQDLGAALDRQPIVRTQALLFTKLVGDMRTTLEAEKADVNVTVHGR